MGLIDLINQTLENLADTSFSLQEYQKQQMKKQEELDNSIFSSDVLTQEEITKAKDLDLDDFYVFYVQNLNK